MNCVGEERGKEREREKEAEGVETSHVLQISSKFPTILKIEMKNLSEMTIHSAKNYDFH